ncbi:hypothetical protein EI94DRAFT_1832183 [Lactarius quietus]|nr:hypothetical protein EI94DRAFT_1832183 [Lactarius quietus]
MAGKRRDKRDIEDREERDTITKKSGHGESWKGETRARRQGKSRVIGVETSGYSRIRRVYLKEAILGSWAPSSHPLTQLIAFSIGAHASRAMHPAQRLSCRHASSSSSFSRTCLCSRYSASSAASPCSSLRSLHAPCPFLATHLSRPVATLPSPTSSGGPHALTHSSNIRDGHTVLMLTAWRAFPTPTVTQDCAPYLGPIPLPDVCLEYEWDGRSRHGAPPVGTREVRGEGR